MKYRLSVLFLTTLLTASAMAEKPRLSFAESDGQLAIYVNDQAIASYIYDDPKILRPYFAHVKTPDGIQVTRNHPPQPGDRNDHATMHPGIWLAFGDISGSDFWRNKASVTHVGFIQPPAAERNVGSFIQQKRYVGAGQSVVCDEEFRVAVRATDGSYVLFLESIFSSDREFYFGDQEEMGLGIRVATPISELGGGHLTDSKGRKGAGNIWSNSAAWCDYSGQIDGQNVGMTIMSHPSNFRESWLHARDYGLVAANPFGRAAMKKGDTSQVVLKPGETLRLRYAIWIHGKADRQSIVAMYSEYAQLGR
jgi:hypothetical protein